MVRGFRKTRFKGIARTRPVSWFLGAGYNLLRMAKLLSSEGGCLKNGGQRASQGRKMPPH
jgi:hypothetical protein